MTPSGKSPIRLLLVDDHEVVRLGLKTLFRRIPDIDIVGEAATMHEAISETTRLMPDVILMDINLPDGDGVEACREIRSLCPEARVLFLTSFSDDSTVLSTIFSGASGYLLKEAGGDTLGRAIRDVAAGKSVLDPHVTGRIRENLRSEPTRTDDHTAKNLSPQEGRVLALVSEGKTNKEIATAMGISDKTVKNYLSTVFQKLQVFSRSEAAALHARLNQSNHLKS